MEIKIGVTDSPRELVISSDQAPADVEKVVTAALSKERMCSTSPTRRAAST
ncbi:Protein of uncharacterised function (DUF3107) [Mycobacteroides abscessus subsp. abscessus]|nr:Protein of uncharacterised function (DUF3107) [Mycobacteroides abscessus subsp. abscessus]